MRLTISLTLLGAAAASAPDAGACQAAALDGAADGAVSLLAVKGRALAGERRAPPAGTDAESQRGRLEAARPIAWLHFPKAGSSLENFMIHLPGLCPGIEEDLVISEETMGVTHNRYFKHLYKPLDETGSCPGSFSHWGNHHGAGPFWDQEYEGHAFVMLRQPEQRAMSDYSYFQLSWPGVLPAFNELQFAERVQGCAVRMMTRGGKSPKETCGGRDSGLPTWDEVALAIDRLKGSAFVGITDQWPLSMCLGHRMFGGKCRTSDFVAGRVTTEEGSRTTTKIAPNPHLYDLTSLGNFSDPYDGALYQAGLEIFKENLLRYDVSMESCKPCFEEAGVDFSE